MSDTDQTKGLLLDAYHIKDAVSKIPQYGEASFQLGDLQWGLGLLDADGNVLDIPRDMDELESVIATTTPLYSFINGVIRINAPYPTGDLVPGETVSISNVGILDNFGELVGVVAFPKTIITSTSAFAISLSINAVEGTVVSVP